MHGLLDIFINLQFLSHVIIFKTKVLLPQTIDDLRRISLSCLGPLMWCSCFQQLLIIWFSNILTLSTPDEGYSRNVSCALN